MEIYLCPEWLLGWMGRRGIVDARARVHAGYLLSNLLVVALVPLVPLVPHFCVMQTLFGVPCPGCGVTHALLLAFGLHFRGSIAANPAGLVIASTIGFQLVARPWAMMNPEASTLVSRVSAWLGRIAVGCLLAVWAVALVNIVLLKVSV